MKRETTIRNAGSTLLTVMLIVFIVPLAIGAVMYFSQQQSFTTRKLGNENRAKVISEAGANDAYSLIATNFAARTNDALFPLKSFGGGSYDANVITVSSNRAVICCTGWYGTASARTVINVTNNVQVSTNDATGPSGTTDPYAYAIMANGAITISGSGDFNVGSNGFIQGNTSFTKSGSGNFLGNRLQIAGTTAMNLSGSWTFDMDVWANWDATISGSGQINHNMICRDLTCSGSFKILQNGTVRKYSKSGSGGIMGTLTTNVTPNVPAVGLPSNINWQAYCDWASANGQRFSGNKSISGSSPVVPTGGIMWVDGTLTISGSGNLTGCFIATAGISISGSGNQIKVGNFPALLCRDGNIDISGSQSFHGLIYAKTGNFGKSGSGAVIGSIICNGTFTASGSWGLMTYEYSCPPASPGSGSGSGSQDRVKVEAWQE